ncbi:MAG TPA: M10 family metallopeptidase [Geminicoccus sp.]|jgi:serralysin|uniref:M10 family metallopeptidase n=1 Tax=Geminicoccus sp. TaxID=2024832 RepID=UPI002E368CA0|nr:M10 family metallopeptidase [Geminicoccus sp.]HEX2529539.1 M10 family metallopeptidase [Geminicoccus sp.]
MARALDASSTLARSASSSPVADVGPSGDLQVDAISSHAKWGTAQGTGATVTYSFAEYGSSWVEGYAEPDNGFQPLSQGQRTAVRAALASWEKIGNIDFVEVQETATSDGDIRFGVSDLPLTAESRLPGRAPDAGDIWLGSTDHQPSSNLASEQAKYAPGSYEYAVLVHEIGHAIGAKHPHDPLGGTTILPASEDWLGASVMSYRDVPSDPVSNGASASTYPSGPMALDVDWIRSVYGGSAKSNLADTVYRWAPGEAIFETVVDDGGTDTLDWSNQTTAARLELNGGWQEVGPFYRWDGGSLATTLFLYGNSTIENARGGSGNDRLLGNDKANLLIGNGGDDRLAGRGGADRLEGGAGNDTYVAEAGVGSDVIIDTGGVDRIEFGPELAFLDLLFTIDGPDLHVRSAVGSTGLDLLLANQLAGNVVEQLQFRDEPSLFTWNGSRFSAAPVAVQPSTEGPDLLILTDGPDTMYALGGDDVVFGKAGNDLIDGGNGRDWLVGGLGDDQLVGGNREDKLDGGEGSDQLFGGAAADVLRGGSGNDTIQAGDGDDIVFGAPGDDTLYGGEGADRNLVGGLGDDTIYAGADDDSVDGASGRDVLDGGDGNDQVVGGAGDDDLGGAGGDDALRGGFGNDQLDGGVDQDILAGGFGNDLLLGGDGQDTALFNGSIDQYQFRELANGDVELRHVPTAGVWYGLDQLSQIELVKFGNAVPIVLD